MKLEEAHRRIVECILDAELPGAEVYVFGSRAINTSRPFSDLDLLVQRPAHLSVDERIRLRDAFEASELPFRVDVVEAASLAPGFAERVTAQRVSLR